MNINKIFSNQKLSLVCASLLVINSACTDSFESYNTNKHDATEDMMLRDNLRTGSFFSQLERSVVLFDDRSNLSSDYQVAQGLSSDLFSGYYAPTGSWYNGVHNGSYYFITGWIEKTFTAGYIQSMSAWDAINTFADEQGLPEISALATIVKVEAMHRVADAYGPIPYCNFKSGSLQNNYDALEDVYAKFFEELDNAIDVLTIYANGGPNATLLEDYDVVYGGNVTKWVKFANTLRLRLAMRIVYANPTLAKTEAEKSISNSIGLITSSGERATIKHSSNLSYIHPLYDIAYNFNQGEARMGASMDAYMNGYKDPRLSAYFKAAAADGNYHGVRLGIETSVWSKYVGEDISNLNIDVNSTEVLWMTAAESYFLRAEGALRGWAMGGTARELYEDGITVSFEENKVTGAGSYIADNTSTPIAFTDNAEGSGLDASAPSDIKIAWDESSDFESNLERIITQKWIALYPDGPEGWAEFRRTGYPKLLPVVTNNSNGTIDTDIQVRRIPFPQSEYNTNNAGVQTGVSKLGGQDNGGTKLWWDKK